MKKSRAFIKILVILVLVPLFAWSFTASAVSAPAQDVYPGINAPWTEPKEVKFKGTIPVGDISDITGPAGKTCYPISMAIADWFRYVNEYLGGIEGYKVVVDSVDTKFDPQNIINSTNRFIDEGKLIVYSPIAYAIPAPTEIFNRRKAVMLAPSGAVPQAFRTVEAAKKGDNYFFQLSPVMASRMDIIVKFFMADWKKKGQTRKPLMATLQGDFPVGHESTYAARRWINKYGAEYTVSTFYGMTLVDGRSQITALKNSKCDYIVGGPGNDQPITVLALELGRQVTPDWKPVYCGHTDFGTSYLETKHKAFEGHYSYQYTLDWDDTDAPIIKWVQAINKRWHPEVKRRPLTYNFGIQAAIVMTEALKRAIKKYGDPKSIDGEKMRQILETFDKFDPLGISGPITYNKYDHQGSSSLRIAENKNHTLVPATGWIVADTLTDEQRDPKYWQTYK